MPTSCTLPTCLSSLQQSSITLASHTKSARFLRRTFFSTSRAMRITPGYTCRSPTSSPTRYSSLHLLLWSHILRAGMDLISGDNRRKHSTRKIPKLRHHTSRCQHQISQTAMRLILSSAILRRSLPSTFTTASCLVTQTSQCHGTFLPSSSCSP